GIRAFKQETQDLDVEIKQMNELKASYGVTTPQELRCNQVNEGMSQHPSYDVNASSCLRLNQHRSIMAEGDIDNLIMEQYLALTQRDQASRNIDCGSSNSEGIATIVRKLDSQGRDMKKLKEKVHAIQVGCQLCEEDHLNKECPLNEEVKSIDEKFVDPPFEEEILAFMRELGYPDLVYQIKNKEAKKNKDMYSLRFTKVIINHFMSKDQSIPRRNKVDWHIANDDPILTIMRFIPKHETVQKYGAILPDTLTNQVIKESDAYKTYYDIATGKEIPKPKIPDVPTYGSNDEEISWKSSDDEDDDAQDDDELFTFDEEERQDEEDKEAEGSDLRVQTPSHFESTDDESTLVSSGFISNMLNPTPDACIDSIIKLNTESTSLVDFLVTTNFEIPPSSVTTLPPLPIPLINPLQQTSVFTPIITTSISLQTLPTFGSLFKFKYRVKALKDDFLKFKQTNIFAEAVSSILDEAQAENEDYINKRDENIKKIIKEKVKVQVKEEVSKIFPRIKKLVNEQLEADVLIGSSNEAKISHAAVANLSKLELKKILIDKMESNISIHRSDQQNTLYKDEDEESSAGSNQGSKRRRAGKEPESTSAPKEKTSKSTGSSKEWSKFKTRSTDKSAQGDEEVYTVKDLEEPTH
nr:hypothetical protein [Tanacetum cinerariifolium]